MLTYHVRSTKFVVEFGDFAGGARRGKGMIIAMVRIESSLEKRHDGLCMVTAFREGRQGNELAQLTPVLRIAWPSAG